MARRHVYIVCTLRQRNGVLMGATYGEGKALLHFRIANGSSDSTLPLVQYYYTCASDETVWLVKSGSLFFCVLNLVT
ncbi:Uncharacterized protein APZ42_028720 [Daphnia magna]|uniref:Uncharacterized protein n=1 Tax=Daphnia magna TaxID=35525 RepID=A0A0P6AUL3_9CRUS|nr:Uncharacterized protein APZ42_028720 [Daphnia magna]